MIFKKSSAFTQRDHKRTQKSVIWSASHWSPSVGTEESIHQAYYSVFRDSNHHIYFENQFFVSYPTKDNAFNKISQTA